MRIFCISDPHLGRDMSRFGEVWIDHETKIGEHWRAMIRPDDLVLIPGDFSWATTNKTIEKHLAFIDDLPGTKVLSPGNHDKWWKKVERLHPRTIHLMNDAHVALGEGWTLAATMGCEQPESPWWQENMKPEFEEACRNLGDTLRRAETARPGTRILLMIHYPPRWDRKDEPSAFEEIIARHPVEVLVYGHIHGVDLPRAFNEKVTIFGRPVRYENASVDRTLMKPILIMDDPALRFELP